MADKRVVKLLKRKRRALDLPSSSEEDSLSPNDMALVSQPPIAQPSTLSQASPAPTTLIPVAAVESSSAVAVTSNKNRRAQFDKRFETSTTSKESVLREFS